MEKNRASVIAKSEHFVWHSRKTLYFGQAKSRFNELHPDPKRVDSKRKNDAEKTIFEILRNKSPKLVEEIEIKHITGEQ